MSTTPIEWLGQTFDSHEELYFAHWCEEVKAAGLICDWQRDLEPWPLTMGMYHEYLHTTQLKTKTKTELKRQTLLRPSEYTPDFKIRWHDDAQGVLFQCLATKEKITKPFIAQVDDEGYYSYIEIKPEFDRNNMTRAFVMNQKFLWSKYMLYINLIHITELFRKTFTPERYTLTATGLPRKIKWETQPITKYLAAHD